jgi:hypothetical protein
MNIGSTELLIILFVLGILLIAIILGRKKPRLAASLLLGFWLMFLILSFKLRDLLPNETQEGLRIGNTILLIFSFVLLIPGIVYLLKSSSKKE